MAAPQLNEEEVLLLCNHFQELDTNGDGFLDPTEIDSALQKLFDGVHDELLVKLRQVILVSADRNDDGLLDVKEFIELVRQRQLDAILQVFAAAEEAANGDIVPLGTEADGENPDLVASIVAQLSQDEIDMLRDCFIKLDQNGDGFVDREELMNGVRPIQKERFEAGREYLEKIFDVADKDHDGMLSLTEFLASFAEGPGAVPHEVVMECVARVRIRLTDEEIAQLQDTFHSIDKNADGFIDREELLAALKQLLQTKFPDLTDQSFSDIVTVVLATADTDRDGRLNLAEFIRSFQEDQGVLPSHFITGRTETVKRKLTKTEIEALKEAFVALDENADGFIDYRELYQAVSEVLSQTVESADDIKALTDMIMVTADRNRDGRLTLTEFIRNFKENEEIMTAPILAAAERIDNAKRQLSDLVESGDMYKLVKLFHFLDANEDGYLSKQELHNLLFRTIAEWYPEWEDEKITKTITIIYDAADVNKDGLISIEEFIASFVRGYGILPLEVVRELGSQLRRRLSSDELKTVHATFVAMDRNGDGFVSRDELSEAFRQALAHLQLPEDVINELGAMVLEHVDRSGDGRISLKEFIMSFELDEGMLPVLQQDEAAQQQEQEQQPGAQHVDPSSVEEPSTLAEPETTTTAEVAPPEQPKTSDSRNVELNVDRKQENLSPIRGDVSGACISDQQLRREFRKYDRNGSGTLDKEEFKKAYLCLDWFGLAPSNREFEEMWSRFVGNDSVLSYEEFALFMLHKSRM